MVIFTISSFSCFKYLLSKDYNDYVTIQNYINQIYYSVLKPEHY